MSTGRWGAVGPSEPPAAAPSPRRRNLFSFSLFSPPLVAGRPRGLSAIPAALSALALGALFLFAAAPAAAQGSVEMDRSALVALYDATGGPTWTDNTNWLSADALSAWHGVSTDATGRVTDLYLTQNNLSGAIPAALGDLTSLQNLYLWQNNLSGEIPAELGDLTSLQNLFLEDNNLSGAIPAKLGDLANLQNLYLAQNGLSGAIPAALGDLTSLLTLDLRNNNLSGAIPAKLGDLASLLNLFLRDNNLSGAIPTKLGDLASLQNLFLRNNNLSGAIPAALGDLVSGSVKVISEGPIGGRGRCGSQLTRQRRRLPGAPPGGRHHDGICAPQPGIESGVGALRIEARGRAARRREYPSGGQRANGPAHRRDFPRHRHVRLRGVGALRCGRGGAVHRRGPGNGSRQPHLYHRAGGPGGGGALTSRRSRTTDKRLGPRTRSPTAAPCASSWALTPTAAKACAGGRGARRSGPGRRRPDAFNPARPAEGPQLWG